MLETIIAENNFMIACHLNTEPIKIVRSLIQDFINKTLINKHQVIKAINIKQVHEK